MTFTNLPREEQDALLDSVGDVVSTATRASLEHSLGTLLIILKCGLGEERTTEELSEFGLSLLVGDPILRAVLDHTGGEN